MSTLERIKEFGLGKNSMTKDLTKFENISIDWNDILADDPDILGGILRDVVKRTNKSKRSLERRERIASINQISGLHTLSEERFNVSLNALRAGRPVDEFAEILDIPVFVLEPLLDGEVTPDVELLAEIAEDLGKPHNYFLEYRIHFILKSIEDFLLKHPETVNAWMKEAS